MRSWSYKQATESTEKQIASLAESAKKRLDQGEESCGCIEHGLTVSTSG